MYGPTAPLTPKTASELLDFVTDTIRQVALVLLDAQGLVTDWNPSAERMLGYSPFEVLGRPYCALFGEAETAAGLPQQLLDDAGRHGRLQIESRWQRKDGSLFGCALTLQPLRQEGQAGGFALIVHDRERLQRLEAEMAEAREKLKDVHKLELLGQLIGGAAHDFTTMMTMARDTLARLRQPELPEADRALCHRSLDETIDQASGLATQLLTYGHQQPLRHTEFDVVECLLNLRPLVESMLGDTIALKLRLAPDLIPVHTDRHHLETAILNLVANARDAIKADKGHGLVTITAQPITALPPIRTHPGEAGAYAAITVTDTGPGIPSEIRNQIFTPFFSTRAHDERAGLGLAQVMSFARQSGGNVEIGNGPQGAAMTLYLPRVQRRGVMPLNVETSAPDTQPLPELAGALLLVEDNARVAEMTLLMLEDIGLSAIWARDAEEALSRLHEKDGGFDLVLTDIVMPRMSGIALARIIANRWPELPVVLVSGYSDDLTTGYGGDLDLIQKPFTRKGLATALARHLKPAMLAEG